MEIKKENPISQWMVLLCICLFPCGAYFVYDSPAALQRYFKPGLEITNSEYMSYYTWYSAPNIVMCIVGGILVDNVFGRRLGAVIFCGCVFLGQLLFAFGISNKYQYVAKIGRTVTGMGVESIAVASKCFITWWYTGTKLYSFAFGICIAFWRVSSSVSLMTMVPYYNENNGITPSDGIIEQFATCIECSVADEGFIKKPENKDRKLYDDIMVFGEDNEYNHDQTYYCYDKNTIESCQMTTEESINFWNEGDKSQACPEFNDATQEFLDKSKLIEYNCFNPTSFTFNQENCNCLDPEYIPVNKWVWADDMYAEHNKSLDANKFNDIDTLRDPSYWLSYFGDYLYGEEFTARQEYFNALNNLKCAKWQNVPANFSRYSKPEGTDGWSVQSFVKVIHI